MDHRIIMSISNSALEYRRQASKLSELANMIRMSGNESEYESDCAGIATEIESQVFSLTRIANDLDEAAANYQKAGSFVSDQWMREENDQAQPEFGTSEFSNLSRHEKLIPIHSE